MDNLASLWNSWSLQRRVMVVGGVIGIFALIALLARGASTPHMTLLYANLDASTAGEVIASLEQEGVTYNVRGGALYVPQAERDRLRLTLAAQGLPANTNAGYELLENMSGFGTTSQMFDAAYWRAKEGELARTIMASPMIQMTRVHIAKAQGNPFQRDDKSKASVSVVPTQGSLSAQQTRAIQFLVASAVPGLAADDVSVLDAKTGRLLSNGAEDTLQTASTDRATELKQRVERLLAARVGPGNFVVEVSVDTNRDQERLVERIVDPSSRVVISTEIEERATQSSDNGATAGVTVASNLPEGDAGNGSRQSNSEDSSTRERINYDVSATEREIQRAPGQIERLTIAVLVDGQSTVDEAGAPIWAPRDTQELETLQALVESAVGFSAERGDTVTIKSLELQPAPEALGTVGAAAGWSSGLDLGGLIRQLVLAAVVLAIAFFVLRPALTATATPSALPAPTPPGTLPANTAAQLQANTSDAPVSLPDLPPLTGTIEDDDAPFELPQMGSVTNFDAFTAAPGSTPEEDDIDPVERLTKLIEDRREETIEILRGWMEENEERA